jgi:ribosomal protein S18 acetylase RimI-like enzyme
VSVPQTWIADLDEAETVASLLVAFRNHMGKDWPSDNAFLAVVEKLMEDQRTEFLLGAPHADAPPSGVVQLRYRLSVWTASDDCWLEDLYVREDARGSGLGRALVERAAARASERGCRRLELDVAIDNAVARRLYDGAGFGTKSDDGDLFLQRPL